MSKKYNAVATSEKDSSQTFLKGAAILTVSMVIVKLFGLLDKILLANIYGMFGDSASSIGLGLYSNAFEVFNVIFTVATGGLPIAISRLVSQNMAQKRYKDVKLVHRISVPLFSIVGIICFIIIIGASVPYATFVIKQPYSIPAMICLAPTVLFGCVASIYRGYFEGQRNMFPTAISEVIEAGVKLLAGTFLAYFIIVWGMDSYNNNGTFLWFTFSSSAEAEKTILSYSVAGAIIGISLGSILSFLFIFLKYKIGGDGIPKEYYQNSIEARAKRDTFIVICKTAIPIATGTLVMSLGSLIDQIILQNVLLNIATQNPDALYSQYSQYYSDDVFFQQPITIHTSLLGCYSAAITLMQLVNSVTQVFGSSATPNVTSAWTKGDKTELKRSINTVVRMTMMFTLPMAFGLCVLAHPIMGLIYSDRALVDIGGNVLTLMGITTIFTAAITPVCSMLNAIGKVKLPMKIYTMCMLIKIGTTWMFVSIPEINIQGATTGSLIAYAISFVVGMYLLIKNSKVVPDFFGTTVKPLIGSVFSSATAFFINMWLNNIIPQRISTIISVLAAIVVYFIVLLLMKTFTSTEIKFLPKGEKIAKVLEKWHLIG
ncbi:polysaccharide biosynthesis C-terminal domain-containing protein [Ruminococcus sp. YE282]|uniref:putative polysaccharide biosynthesis protein n=1 Tax=Ruminococcus sp. YE282 TaxID=3158780 RepID=UPI00087EBBE2|nr:polysaccharide biosynthesis C-terminal domain-containing protein [Ruminococcus bromii]MEE3498285.1 polysaccharide biosynthesis C-terminal domain-containing protein [Ruminococcus bromii]SCY07222.1 Polysaccharide biosynthesis protein [Ruminococcus bromii]